MSIEKITEYLEILTFVFVLYLVYKAYKQ